MDMGFFEWSALVAGAGLTYSGVRAISRREAHVPELREGESAVRLGWLWIVLGMLFILSVIFDIAPLKTLFRLFLEAAN
jgi:hypothetical protein